MTSRPHDFYLCLEIKIMFEIIPWIKKWLNSLPTKIGLKTF